MPICNDSVCKDRDRQNLVLKLAHDAVIEASQTLLEIAVRDQDDETIEVSQRMLENILSFNVDAAASSVTDSDRVFVTDAFQSYLKTTQTVLAKGTPLMVLSGECKITDCPSCFWEAICSREETEALIARSREIVDRLKQSEKTKKEKTAYLR
jgi:hypothetical protein